MMAAFREDSPSIATRPDRIVGIPILMGLFCAKEMLGSPIDAKPRAATDPLMTCRLCCEATACERFFMSLSFVVF